MVSEKQHFEDNIYAVMQSEMDSWADTKKAEAERLRQRFAEEDSDLHGW
jgi:hypothetical protein